jgi:hypothetical protein
MLFFLLKIKESDVHEPFCKLFCKNDQFEETNLNEVLDNPDLIPEFKITRLTKEKKIALKM